MSISVTVIGGYLGAGKTTLINHLLSTATERLAVLVNDFGTINIDAALIESADDQTISLANGCICCSLIDGFASAMEMITEFDPVPDRLIIEASGVANPATVASWGYQPGFGLDATIVMVDASTIRSKASDRYVGDTVTTQLASADILVVNKMDLVDADDGEPLKKWLATLSPASSIVTATQSRLDPAVLFGSLPKVQSSSVAPLTGSPRSAEDTFETVSWSSDSHPLKHSAIKTLMADIPSSIVRVKGVLWLDNDPYRQTILQRVGSRWTLESGDAWGGRPESQLAAIAVGPDATMALDELRSHLGAARCR